jgi:hypothetical protein
MQRIQGRLRVRTPWPMGRPAAMGFIWLVVVICGCSHGAQSQDLALSFGPSEKVCQLTGEKDWASGDPTTTTFNTTQSGLMGTDLGYPVEHNQRLALLFGDTRSNPPRGSDEIGPPDDAVGWITSRTPPTADACTDLRLNTEQAAANLLRSPIIVSDGVIKQGLFNVPSGGVSSDGWLYAFFWTDHCNNTPKTPCPETEGLNSIGRGVLARSNDQGATFVDPVPMPKGFVYSTAVNATRALETTASRGRLGAQRLGVFVFAVPRYRGSVPYLAYAPPGKTGNPSAWSFLVGLQSNGQPSWTSFNAWQSRARGHQWTPPGHPEIFSTSGADRCVGEFSVTWNQPLNVWLLLYNCNLGRPSQSIVARIAEAPWGPWSEPQVVLDPDRDGSWCKLLMRHKDLDGACKGRPDDWSLGDGPRDGDFYAPFVMERYTTPERTFFPRRRVATIYWLVSTWNPYQVIVMRTRLQVDPLSLARGRRGLARPDSRGIGH